MPAPSAVRPQAFTASRHGVRSLAPPKSILPKCWGVRPRSSSALLRRICLAWTHAAVMYAQRRDAALCGGSIYNYQGKFSVLLDCI